MKAISSWKEDLLSSIVAPVSFKLRGAAESLGRTTVGVFCTDSTRDRPGVRTGSFHNRNEIPPTTASAFLPALGKTHLLNYLHTSTQEVISWTYYYCFSCGLVWLSVAPGSSEDEFPYRFPERFAVK